MDDYLDPNAWAAAIRSLQDKTRYQQMSGAALKDWANPIFSAEKNAAVFLEACESALCGHERLVPSRIAMCGQLDQMPGSWVGNRLADWRQRGLWRTLAYLMFIGLTRCGLFLCWVQTRPMTDASKAFDLPSGVSVERLT